MIPARADLLTFTEFGGDIIDYVRGAGFEPKVFLPHVVSADYAGPCGGDSVIGSDPPEEVLTAVSGERSPGRWPASIHQMRVDAAAGNA